LRVIVSDDVGDDVTLGLGRWLARIAPVAARGVVNVALVSDARVRALNRRYRRRDRPTDVLSFGYALPADGRPRTRPADFRRHHAPVRRAPHVLGDIVIARGVAERQARDAGHDTKTEVRILALHGLLHLLGYDHHHDGGRMARRERLLRRKGGLPTGLIERSRS
jgi:probable rRNA maturation factor